MSSRLSQGIRKLCPWLFNRHREAVLTGFGVVVALSGCSVYLLPQSFFLERCKQWFQLYEDGYPAALPKALEERGQKVLAETTLTDKKKATIRFFSVYGFDVYHLGTTSTKQGVYIGIPKNYKYEKPQDIEQHTIMLEGGNPVQWSTMAGQNLQEALVLSENAQNFGIAREIYASSYPRLHLFGLGTSLAIITVFALAKLGNARMNLLQRSFAWRGTWYALSTFMGGTCWLSVKDGASVHMDKYADEWAADLGINYVQGGVEYYEKKMLLNRSLRTLLGTRGENTFSANGNYNILFRTRALPLSHKLDTLKNRLKEMQEKEKPEDDVPFEV